MLPHNPRQPYKVRCRDETGFIHLVFFNAPRRLSDEGCCRWARRASSAASVERYRQGRAADDPSRPRRAAGGAGDSIRRSSRSIALTAGLTPKVAAARRSARPSSARPSCRNGRTPPTCKRQGWPGWHAALARGASARRASATWRSTRRRASGWPSTSCWPTSSRSPWCAPISAGMAGRAHQRQRAPARRRPSPPCPSR